MQYDEALLTIEELKSKLSSKDQSYSSLQNSLSEMSKENRDFK